MIKFIYTCGENELCFSNEEEVRITNIDGLNGVSVSLSEATVTGQVGASITSRSIEPKDITIEGRFMENAKIRSKMIRTILPSKTAILRYIDTDSGIDVFIEGEPKQTPYISNQKYWQSFQFVIRAPYPYWRNYESNIIPFMNYTSDFRFPRSYSSTVQFKISSRETHPLQAIFNDSAINCGMKITMKALSNDIKAPYVINVDTQEKIRFGSITLSDGDLIEVSTFTNNVYCKLIRNNVESNIYADTDYDSIFFQLNSGTNVIRCGADTNEKNLDVRIEFETVYLGV